MKPWNNEQNSQKQDKQPCLFISQTLQIYNTYYSGSFIE